MDKTPTIKGIFVNSHVKKVRQEKGEEGVSELESRFGGPINFGNFQDVPVRDEVRLIECALDVLRGTSVPEASRAFEAGRLHFQDFIDTPLGRIIFSQFKNNFKTVMMNSSSIAGHVFRGISFYSEEMGPKSVKVTLENNDYPIDHFKGLFQEWMNFSGLSGTVDAKETAPNRYEYTASWQ
jgi:uncharacterized protein (TIGR02265 family)